MTGVGEIRTQKPGSCHVCSDMLHTVTRYEMSRSMKTARLALGDLEHELLILLWKHGEMTATAVRKHVARKLKDPTIRTVLRRLEEKGYVTHSVVSGTFIYRARESAEATAAIAVRSIVDRFCGGSLERVLQGLVDTGFADVNQLAAFTGRLKRKSR